MVQGLLEENLIIKKGKASRQYYSSLTLDEQHGECLVMVMFVGWVLQGLLKKFMENKFIFGAEQFWNPCMAFSQDIFSMNCLKVMRMNWPGWFYFPWMFPFKICLFVWLNTLFPGLFLIVSLGSLRLFSLKQVIVFLLIFFFPLLDQDWNWTADQRPWQKNPDIGKCIPRHPWAPSLSTHSI